MATWQQRSSTVARLTTTEPSTRRNICALKSFWCFAHNSLPLRLNLRHRRLEVDTIRPICNRLDEDGGFHPLISAWCTRCCCCPALGSLEQPERSQLETFWKSIRMALSINKVDMEIRTSLLMCPMRKWRLVSRLFSCLPVLVLHESSSKQTQQFYNLLWRLHVPLAYEFHRGWGCVLWSSL